MKFVGKLCIVLTMVLAISGMANAFDITFQVNMAVQQSFGNFDPATMTVQVRGDWNGWAGDDMTTENDSIYVTTLDIPTGTYGYKFVFVDGDNVTYEDPLPNRELDVGDNGFTLDPVYFADQGWAPLTSVEVLFQVDMSIKILQGGFDPAVDLVVVRGSHDAIGNWGGAVALTLDEDDIYTSWIQFENVPVGSAVEFKYVVLTNGDPEQADWEAADNRTFIPTGDENDGDSNGFGEIVTDIAYFSNVGPDDVLTQDLMVVYTIDARPPYYMLMDLGYVVDVQTDDTLRVEDIGNGDGNISWIDIAGANPLSWDWGSIPDENKARDNGAGFDEVEGDSIFTVGIQYFAGDPNAQEWKCGIEGFDCEAGFAMNHNTDFIDEGGEFIVMAQFGSQDTLYDDYFEYDVIEVPVSTMPTDFVLEQNYPNPFNPSTSIAFNLPERAEVVVSVYDINGREVFKDIAGVKNAGRYEMTFNANPDLSSGVYFYKVEAGKYNATKRMYLIK